MFDRGTKGHKAASRGGRARERAQRGWFESGAKPDCYILLEKKAHETGVRLPVGTSKFVSIV